MQMAGLGRRSFDRVGSVTLTLSDEAVRIVKNKKTTPTFGCWILVYISKNIMAYDSIQWIDSFLLWINYCELSPESVVN
jgi:hypothetical protein